MPATWSDAARRLDASPSLLRLARSAARRGGAGAAIWTAAALSELRGARARPARARFAAALALKYGAATAAAALAVAAAAAGGAPWWLAAPLAPLAFYLAEAPTVYLFPALVDGARSPWRLAYRLARDDGGLLRTAARTSALAARMLTGGPDAAERRRAWCAGCFAVLLRYEDLRRCAR